MKKSVVKKLTADFLLLFNHFLWFQPSFFKYFLMDGQEAFVLLDEPENSLDISWQYELINTLEKLNPNAQYFITTHSPSIFGDGWGDKIIYMEDVTTPIVDKK